MKFIVKSSELNNVLQSAGKVINPKHPIPIMEYFVFVLEAGKLEITASDQETTQISKLEVTSMERSGSISVPSRLILEVLKEIADQPITIEVKEDTFEITVDWGTGSVIIPGQSVDGYPDVKSKNTESLQCIEMSSDALTELINLTLFAAADRESRHTMNGINFDIEPDKTTVVATDAHKLVRVSLDGMMNSVSERTSFILPKKPASNLKALLSKESTAVKIEFDSKNIHFSFGDTIFICRTIEGKYPNYNSVIPTGNDNKIIIDRIALLTAIRRVSVCSDKSSNMVKMYVSDNNLSLQAKDINFYVSAADTLVCNHEGGPMEIGFRYMHLIEILTAFTSTNVEISLSDGTRPGLFVPTDAESENEKKSLVLLMPII